MTKYLLFFTFLFSFVQAQNKLISGKIIVDEENESNNLQGILVINLMTNAETTTNSKGMFSIKVNPNDELRFKNGGVEERIIKISEAIFNKGFVSVHLNVDVIELKETVLNTLNKNWLKNVKLKYDSIDELYAKLDLGIDPNLRFQKIDIDKITRYVNGSRKLAKRNRLYFKKIKALEKIEDYFTKAYFTEKLKIPDYKISEFLLFCDAKNNLEEVVNKNNFELIEKVLKTESLIYLSKLTAIE